MIDIKSTEKIDVEIKSLRKKEILKLDTSQFESDWSTEIEYNVVKLQIKNTFEVVGIMSMDIIPEELRIEIRLLELSKLNIGRNKKIDRVAGILIAHSCKLSFELGFFGFVSLVPKTNLINHYQSKYGFIKCGRQLAIDFDNSALLIEKYLM